ncbi:MAG: hypothetical protein HQ485_07345 [Acidobacteria bacterium]|jgi:hypothetical protein|nr:hypothetical protein [Acidobacteriota bacterium]
MNDARESTNRLDNRMDALTAEMHAGFKNVVEQTQAGFEDHRLYTEFLVTGLRDDMGARFNQVDRRFDAVDQRFDRLERLIRGEEL